MFFSTYVYQLPTHHCPFCLLQKDYYYVGYILYATLYVGTFFGISGAIMSAVLHTKQKRYFYISILSNTAYALIVTAYVVVYYFKNGVFL